MAQKDGWDKANVIIKAFVPLTVLVMGLLVNSTLKDREIRARHLEVALSILQGDSAKTPVERELRRWAGQLFVETSPVHVPSPLQEALKAGTLSLPVAKVDERGLVTAISPGRAALVYRRDGVTDTAWITVIEPDTGWRIVTPIETAK